MMRKNRMNTGLALLLSVAIVSCGDAGTANTTTDSTATTATSTTTDMAGSTDTTAGTAAAGAGLSPSKNIVENAVASPDHTTLVSAVQAADLAGTLSGAGPFTVFAPTNAAFGALPAGTVDNLLKPESKDKLTSILTYHVVPGSVKAADLKDGQKIKTVQGAELTVSIKDGKVMIDGANVTTPDVMSSNGVIHVIDAVVMPKK